MMLLSVVLVFVLAAFPVEAAKRKLPITYEYKTKGQSVTVWTGFCATDDICTSIMVDASESMELQDSSKFKSNIVNVAYTVNDYGAGVNYYAHGTASFPGFRPNVVKKNAPPIKLRLSLNVCNDGATDCKFVNGIVTITPNSDYVSTNTCESTSTYNSPHLVGKYKYNSSGNSASAIAVVDLAVDGVTIFEDNVFYAEIYDSKSKIVEKSISFQ